MNDSLERMLIAQAYESKIPLSGSLELTPLCTMDCDMCYVKLTPKEQEAQGKILSADEWLDIGKQMQKAGILFVLLTGGEPLLHPEFKEIYLGLKKLGMVVTLNTNGTLIDEAWADFFWKNPPRRINISLYGGNENTYEKICHHGKGFEQTIRAIRLLKERNIQVKMNGSLVRENADDLDMIVETAKKLETAINVDTYMYPVKSRAREEQVRLSPEDAAKKKVQFQRLLLPEEEFCRLKEETLRRAKKVPEDNRTLKVRCQAGSSSFSISWKGEMSPCVMLKEIGKVSVLKNGFSNSWEKIREATEQIRLYHGCATCSMRNICETCAASALHEVGDCAKKPEYVCRYTKAYLEEIRR